MGFWEEIIASRKVGYRRIDPSRGDWEDLGMEKYLSRKTLLLRFKATIDFVSQSVGIKELQNAKILDTGEYNPMSKWLKDSYNISVENTPPDMDFDYSYRFGKEDAFDYIFAFEIIEHLMNPLMFLEYLHGCLSKNGKLFLSTPFSRPRILWSKYHLTEYFPDKIEIIANKAGFRVTRYKVKKIYDYRYALTGIRPILRAIWFERNMFFEFVKK